MYGLCFLCSVQVIISKMLVYILSAFLSVGVIIFTDNIRIQGVACRPIKSGV